MPPRARSTLHHADRPRRRLPLPRARSEAFRRQRQGHARRPHLLGRRDARCGIRLWRPRSPPADGSEARRRQDRAAADGIDIITGVSGGSFTALAYGLYGDKLFDTYERRFLKRNVEARYSMVIDQSAELARAFVRHMGSIRDGRAVLRRSALRGRDFADLETQRRAVHHGPDHGHLDRIALRVHPALVRPHCSDCRRCASRAPRHPRPCRSCCPDHAQQLRRHLRVQVSGLDVARRRSEQSGAAGRARHQADGRNARVPGRQAAAFPHLVDGGLADNLGMRAVLESLEKLEAVGLQGEKRVRRIKRIVVVVVDSLLFRRPTGTNRRGRRTTSTSSSRPRECRSTAIRTRPSSSCATSWPAGRSCARFAIPQRSTAARTPALAGLINAPSAKLYAIDVSFAKLKDPREFEYLNDLPTTFSLTAQQVDRLRAAAGKILLESPDFQQLMQDVGARIVPATSAQSPAFASVSFFPLRRKVRACRPNRRNRFNASSVALKPRNQR